MIFKMYAIYDSKTCYYHPPMMNTNDEAMCRALLEQFMLKQSMITRFPVDYGLYCIGSFDDNSGKVVQIEPTFIIKIDELIANYERTKGKDETEQ